MPLEQDEWDEEEPLPRHLRAFTSPDLERDEATARQAGDAIWSVHARIAHDLCELEAMERALGQSGPASPKAQHARSEIRRAIDGISQAVNGTDNARCALIFH